MELIQSAIDIFFHLDTHLSEWMGLLQGWIYVLLFVIIFCETGLVVTPFLPGDSLLFAAGALAALPDSPLYPALCIIIIGCAAVLGDAVNFSVGYRVGPKVFNRDNSFWLNKKHLMSAQSFYEKYGGKTIFLARFVPIVRTFAPFVAGIGKMKYRRFAIYNVTGGLTWVSAFILTGYWFGNRPYIKKNFHYVIVAIILISVLPIFIEFFREKRRARREKNQPA